MAITHKNKHAQLDVPDLHYAYASFSLQEQFVFCIGKILLKEALAVGRILGFNPTILGL